MDKFKNARIPRLLVALLSAAVLGTALAPAGVAVARMDDGAPAKVATGADDKCKQIKNKKKRKKCIAKHEGPKHEGPNHQ
jgi:hypothetical protein